MLFPDQYEIQRILHGSDYSALTPHIFLVKDQHDIQHPVKALKFLSFDAGQDQQNNFYNEISVLECLQSASQISNLPHPDYRLINMLHHGETDFHWNNRRWSGRYYAMPFYQRGNLAEFLSDHVISQQLIKGYFISMLSCVDALHQQNHLHLDIKPSNFLLNDQSEINHQCVLIDFSLAQHIDSPPSSRHGGTPRYMSPEQFRHAKLTKQSDFYSLGLILYRMLTGQSVFEAATFTEWAQQHCQQPVPALSGELSTFQPVIDGLLAKNSQYRFKTIAEIYNTFLQACNG